MVEDTHYTIEDIEQLFGETIARIVNGLTKISRLNKEKDASIQAENFRKMLLTLHDDVRVILIKMQTDCTICKPWMQCICVAYNCWHD